MNRKGHEDHKEPGRQHGQFKAGMLPGRRGGPRLFELFAFFVVEENKV